MAAKDTPPRPSGAPELRGARDLQRANPAPAQITPVVTPTPPGEPQEIDEELRGFEQRGPQVVTGVRVYDGAVEWELPRHIKRFHGGASRPPEDRPFDIAYPELSATHFMLERRHQGMRLYDEHSKHGTWVMDSQITTADLRPGSKFTAKPVTFVAMNDAMRTHRPTLVEIMGDGQGNAPEWRSADWMMVEAAGSSHLLITGEGGCWQEQLAIAIHKMSPREVREPVELGVIPSERAAQMAAIRKASKQTAMLGTTVILKVATDATEIDPTFLDLLYSPAYGLRVIVLAPSVSDASRALGTNRVSLCSQVLLRPLALRTSEVPHLLDRMLAKRGASHLRAADLYDDNHAALVNYHWPGNLDELARVADILVAHAAHGNFRQAAEALEGLVQKRSGLQEYMANVLGMHAVGRPSSFFQRTSGKAGS